MVSDKWEAYALSGGAAKRRWTCLRFWRIEKSWSKCLIWHFQPFSILFLVNSWAFLPYSSTWTTVAIELVCLLFFTYTLWNFTFLLYYLEYPFCSFLRPQMPGSSLNPIPSLLEGVRSQFAQKVYLWNQSFLYRKAFCESLPVMTSSHHAMPKLLKKITISTTYIALAATGVKPTKSGKHLDPSSFCTHVVLCMF